MTAGRGVIKGLKVLVAVTLVACSSDKDQSSERWSPEEDRRQIEATLEETATRWHYGDKAILYDQEYEYIRVEYSFDRYLELGDIKGLEADTVRAFRVRDVRFFDRDSALVSVDVVFVGPAGIETVYPQEWTMFYHGGRWIRPTLGDPQGQLDFEERCRKTDSAARAEENEVW